MTNETGTQHSTSASRIVNKLPMRFRARGTVHIALHGFYSIASAPAATPTKATTAPVALAAPPVYGVILVAEGTEYVLVVAFVAFVEVPFVMEMFRLAQVV